MVKGAFRQTLTQTPIIHRAIVYSSFGLSRLLSMVLDGFPSSSLIRATALELVIGCVSFLYLDQLLMKLQLSWLFANDRRGERAAPTTELIKRIFIQEWY